MDSCVEMSKVILLLGAVALTFLGGCGNDATKDISRKELLIYCGTTMSSAVRELADIFEQRENCLVKIIKDGSGNLHRSIHLNKMGDLYLPGSESYVKKCQAENFVLQSQLVGFNKAVLLVAKGNPLELSAELKHFTDNRYRTVLGAAESGSIGRETQLILSAVGIYKQAIDHAIFMAVDSKDIVRTIADKQADLSINWYASALTERNRELVDALLLDESIAPRHPLRLGLLKTSYNPALANRFMTFAGSLEGQSIFIRHGFGE